MKKRETSKIGTAIKSYDAFGVPISLKVNGEDSHKTYFGAFMSLLILILTLFQASKRYETMTSRLDTVHQRTASTNIYQNDDPLTMADAQQNFAFGVYKFNGIGFEPFSIDGYLEMNILQLGWYTDENGFNVTMTPISTHNCTEQDKSDFLID